MGFQSAFLNENLHEYFSFTFFRNVFLQNTPYPYLEAFKWTEPRDVRELS
jgi:hypothetical protein